MQPVSREHNTTPTSLTEENNLPTTVKLAGRRKRNAREHGDTPATILPVKGSMTPNLPPTASIQDGENPQDPMITAKLDQKKRVATPVQPETNRMRPRFVDLSDEDLHSIKFAVTKNVPKDMLQAGTPIVKVRLTQPEARTAGPEHQTSPVNETTQASMPARTAVSMPQTHKSSQSTATSARTPAHTTPTKRQRTKRVPEIRQMTAVECGAACIAMILGYYGRPTRTTEVQEHCGVGRDGLSALSIVKAARTYGMRVRAVSVKKMDARYINLPAIIHWEFNHFVVLERWTTKRVEIVDPAFGRRRLTSEEFGEGFTGVAILLEPGETFGKKGVPHTLSLMSYTRSLLQMRFTAIQIVLASLVVQVLGLGAPLLTAIVVDHILPAHTTNLFTLLGLGIVLLVLSQALMMFLRASLLIYLQTRLDVGMMLNFFEHLLSLPYRFFQIRLSGDLLSRLNSNVVIRDLFTNQLLTALLDVSAVVIYLLILALQSPLIAGIAVAIGVVQVTLLLVSAPALRRLTQRDLAAQGKTQGYLNEALAGIATLKAAGAEQRALERWTNLFFDEMNIAMRRDYLSSIIGSLLGIFQIATPLLLLWVGAIEVTSGILSVGTMLALNVLAVSFLTPLNSLALTGKDIQLVQAHFERLADVLEAQPEQDPQTVQRAPTLTGQVDVEDIHFQYDATLPPVLHDITLHIQPGQKVALVGKTGSGKSTLGKLLIGLITPTQGTIRFNGIPLQELNYREVRSQCGIVLQDAFVFSGSVHENIALNNPEMDMEQVMYAAHAAVLHTDIEAMPMKYETFVAEGGSVLSGGQRQRLALARALANHPAILLLDEATSSLDVVTERIVEHNLRQLACTQVVIAHRLSTIKNADLIVVLDDGCIVEQGTHDALVQANGYYAHLIQAQLENGEIKTA